MTLARRNHEDERAARLEGLRASVISFKQLAPGDQTAIRDIWVRDKWTKYGPPSEAPGEAAQTQAALGQAITLAPIPQDAPSSPGLLLENLQTILRSFQLRDRPFVKTCTGELDADTSEAIRHVRELEVITGESVEAGVIETEPPEDGSNRPPDNAIDQRLHELVPFEDYTETPRQMSLTKEEGRIIETFLGVDGVETEGANEEPMTDTSQRESPTPKASEGIPADLDLVLDKIDRLVKTAPQVRETYARALALPTKEDHEMCRELLVRLGVPVLIAMIPYEAEGLASSLARNGLVDFVGTEDSDVLAYEVGASRPAAQCN